MLPSKPVAHVTSLATNGSKAVLHCTETDGSPPPTFRWYKDRVLMPTDPEGSLAFWNSSYTLDPTTGELGALRLGTPPPLPSPPAPLQIFEPWCAANTGDYSCEATNSVSSPQTSDDTVHMEASKALPRPHWGRHCQHFAPLGSRAVISWAVNGPAG